MRSERSSNDTARSSNETANSSNNTERRDNEASTSSTTPAPSMGSGASSPSKTSESSIAHSEKMKRNKLAFIKHFKKSFDKGKSVPITPFDSLDDPIHQSLLSPAAFWGGDGASGVEGAKSAAKAAMKSSPGSTNGCKKSSDTSSEVIAAAIQVVMSKKERKKKAIIPKLGSALAEATLRVPSTNSKRAMSANESSRMTTVPSATLRVVSPAGTMVQPQRSMSGVRNISGASIATIEVPVPGLGGISIAGLSEMLLVPIDASRMWIRNHPKVMTSANVVLARGWEMGQIALTTGLRVWAVVFVYSKTGKFKMRRGDTAGGFVFDCVRSVAYLMMFMALSVCVMRILAGVASVLRIGIGMVRAIWWMVKKLLGQGILW